MPGSSPPSPPPYSRLLETALFVADCLRAAEFYGTIFGIEPFLRSAEGIGFELQGGQLLLLIDREKAGKPSSTPFGTVPPCIERRPVNVGPGHLALAIAASSLGTWRTHLEAHGVEILEEVRWERGGISLYFRDPDGHLLELATPGVWEVY